VAVWRSSTGNEAESVKFVEDQYAAVRRAVGEYHPDLVLVTGLDIGHTDPQLILPYGGQARVDPGARRITVTY
jgi:muramoyltetrapeptide carboxypeptidase LdcA involved in peptidoglycan recycling